MSETLYFVGFIYAWAFMLLISTGIWCIWIRPYIRKNGKSVGHGANIGWAIISDASTAIDIARANKKVPLFLKVFWALEVFVLIFPIIFTVLIMIN